MDDYNQGHSTTKTSQEVDVEEVNQEPKQIHFLKFFSYITCQDKLLLFFGTLASILAGAILPSISLVMGNVAAAFSGNEP